MATGQTTFSTAGQQVDRGFKPYTPGEYSWALNGAKAEIRQKQEEGAIPYVNVSFRLEGETREDGTPARFTVFHRFFLNLDPGSDGRLMVNRADGIVGFARAVGMNVDIPLVKMTKKMKSGAMQTIDVLDPKLVLGWLKDLDGTTLRARIKTEKGTGGYEDKSVIAEFIAAEFAEEGESEAATLTHTEEEEVHQPEEEEAASPQEEAPQEEEAVQEEEPFAPVPSPKKPLMRVPVEAPKSPAKTPAKPKVVARRK